MTAVFPYQPVAPIPDTGSIKAMTPEAIDMVRQLEVENLKRPQLKLAIHHQLHYGVYTRTLFLPAGTLLTAALIKIPTTLIVQGNAQIFVDENVPFPLYGYNVFSASAGRKVAVLAHSDVFTSMYFATQAKTREEAEREFTDEWADLAEGLPVINITGE